jgi:hypothetical protein
MPVPNTPGYTLSGIKPVYTLERILERVYAGGTEKLWRVPRI